MDVKRIAIIGFLLVIASVVGVQLLDPKQSQAEQTPIQFDGTPSTVAETAVKNLTQRDFTYTMLVTSNRTPEGRMDGFFRRVKVENTDEEYYANVTPDRYLYANDEALWVRDGQDKSWKFGMRSGYTYPAGGLTNPFSISKIQNSSGEVIHENSSTLVIHLDTAATARLRDKDFPNDYTRIYIDKQQERIDRVTFKLNNTEWEPTYLHVRVTAVDETNVQRPPETRPSLGAFILDVLRGPLFRVP